MNRNLGVLLVFYVVAGAAQAADPRACVDIDDAAARLACYDTAFERAPAAARPVPAPSAPAPAAPAESEFGMNDRLRREQSSDEAPPERITATVTAATRNSQGYFNLTLDNGQRWTLTETAPAQAFRPGDVVTIRRASLGSFLLSRATGGQTRRARRAE